MCLHLSGTEDAKKSGQERGTDMLCAWEPRINQDIAVLKLFAGEIQISIIHKSPVKALNPGAAICSACMDAEQTHVATMQHPGQQACCSRDCKPVPGLSSARCNLAEKY